MAGSVNKVILVGNLGRDPEVRTMQNGNKVCNLSIATSERWKDKNSGDYNERTEWHRIVIFDDRLVDVAEKYLQKGAKVYIEGELQTRKWQDNSGQERYTTEVVLRRFRGTLTMLDSRRSDDERDDGPRYGDQRNGMQTGPISGPTGAPPSDDLDDEIPF